MPRGLCFCCRLSAFPNRPPRYSVFERPRGFPRGRLVYGRGFPPAPGSSPRRTCRADCAFAAACLPSPVEPSLQFSVVFSRRENPGPQGFTGAVRREAHHVWGKQGEVIRPNRRLARWFDQGGLLRPASRRDLYRDSAWPLACSDTVRIPASLKVLRPSETGAMVGSQTRELVRHDPRHGPKTANSPCVHATNAYGRRHDPSLRRRATSASRPSDHGQPRR